ncbi:MAG: hypothetical protein Kow00104_14550 [Rhodothalassiaceae bacterium]
MMEQSARKLVPAGSSILVGILSNCAATTNRQRLDELRRAICPNPHIFHYEFEDISQIAQGLRMFADSGVGLLVINGGDGTIQATLSCLLAGCGFEKIPPIAVLPGGKTNMIAGDLGCQGTPARVFRRLTDMVRKERLDGALVRRHVIELDLGDGKPARVGMFLGGAGIVKAIEWVRRTVHRLPLPTRLGHALAIAILILRSCTPSGSRLLASGPIEIGLDRGEHLHGRYIVILATTLSRLLVWLRPFGEEGTGGLKLSFIEARKGAMRRAFFALITGRFQKGGIDGLQVRRSDRLTFIGSDPLTLDGEIYTPLPGRTVTARGDRSFLFVRLKHWWQPN